MDLNETINKCILNQQKKQNTVAHTQIHTPCSRRTISNPSASIIGNSTANYIDVINNNNVQFTKYVNTLTGEQIKLNNATKIYVDNKIAEGALKFRNLSNWSDVKSLAVRSRLMESQMGQKNIFPFSNINEIDLKNIDLSDMSNEKTKVIINRVLTTPPQDYIKILKDLKYNNISSEYIQPSKLEELKKELQNIDLEHITSKEFKHIKSTYLERTEVHHRTGVASDPYLQSDINNLDVLNTTQHQNKHFDAEKGKINYKKPVNEKPNNWKGEFSKLNNRRNFTATLSGIGVAAAIGLGIGFTLGMLTTLAQNGLNPNSLKYAFTSGINQGVKNMATSVVSAGLCFTVGKTTTKFITEKIGSHLAVKSIENIGKTINIGVCGALTTIAFSVYEFAKLKQKGYSTRESLIRTGKHAALSISIVGISMIAQFFLRGYSGVVSVFAVVITIGYSVAKSKYDKELYKKITYHTISLTEPKFT